MPVCVFDETRSRHTPGPETSFADLFLAFCRHMRDLEACKVPIFRFWTKILFFGQIQFFSSFLPVFGSFKVAAAYPCATSSVIGWEEYSRWYGGHCEEKIASVSQYG